MALVSPGISISINDQSQYVNSNVGSVPLVVLATAQDKTYNGATALGTTKANAGKLLSFSSQRDLITQMGTPTFQLSSAGTPVNGSEINEYGLLAAYSALGLSNQLFAIRADIDLNHLIGTSVRPLGAPANGTYWLNTTSTSWGIEVLNQATNSFSTVTPLIITDPAQVQNEPITNTINGLTTNDVPHPVNSIGAIGSYALVFVNDDGTTAKIIRLFYKRGPNSYQGVVPSNTWVEVGSPDWQTSLPAVAGTNSNPTIQTSSTVKINTVLVTSDGTVTTLGGANGLVAKINASAIPGVYASVVNNNLQLYVTSAANSTGFTGGQPNANGNPLVRGQVVPDGKINILDITHSPMYAAGVVTATSGGTATAYSPILWYSDYSSEPASGWYHYPGQAGRPTGSIWWKQGAIGGGFSPTFKQYDAGLDQWQTLSVGFYQQFGSAIYALDPTGGGINITHGTVISVYGIPDATYNSLRYFVQGPGTQTVATGGTTSSFTTGDTFVINATGVGNSLFLGHTCTLEGTSATDFVNAVLSANIPYVTAQVNSNGTISIIHSTGGQIQMQEPTSGNTGHPLAEAGFVSGQGSGFFVGATTGYVYAFLWQDITEEVQYKSNEPYSPPVTGTLWYNSDLADVDIMINNNGWKGYQNVSLDARGYDLTSTNPLGVIVTPTTAPTSQTNGNPLVKGDLWLDSAELVNYPSLYRYNGVKWVAIDNTDHITQNGIIFADARWDTGGTTDVVSGNMPSIQDLLVSDYIDQDAPDYRLFPKGTLLFNMRRSGYNVKKFVANYFNNASFPNLPNVPNASGSLPTIKDAWVTESGLDANGVMFSGSHAQRNIIIGAMKAAVDSNLDLLSPMYQFNLLVAPNYPELIDNLLTLNDNRGDTAFVIGDTPLDLAPNATTIANWVNDTNGATGFVVPSSPYLALYYPAGRTNDLAGNEVVVPASHAALRTYLYSDQVSYPWFAPAGYQRGLVNNLIDIGYIDGDTGKWTHNAINNGLRDALFTLKINPITQFPASGIVVWGQLTRSATTSARDRVNVVRLENYLRTIFQSVANGYLFEPNDSITRKSIASAISGSLNSVLAHRGLYDFLVICDSSNNTSATISNNQLYVDVAIEPERDVEFIYIPIAIYNPGQIAALG
jgi:hypothetical protein